MDDSYPWTTGELKRLSRHVRDGVPANDSHPSYADVMAWFNDLAARVQQDISRLNWPPLLLDRPFEVSSRAKTLDTLRQKLQRDPATPLPSVQDIAGVRFEAEMSLDEQDAVAVAICGMYDHDPAVCIRDMRAVPHSGYRAVHIWLRLPARVEVQIRTHLQGEWANAYEAAADVFGRGIRYGELPADDTERRIVVGLQEMSGGRIASMEKDRNEIEKINLAVEDARRAGIMEIPAEATSRIERLRARYDSNERKMRQQLQMLAIAFSGLRKEG